MSYIISWLDGDRRIEKRIGQQEFIEYSNDLDNGKSLYIDGNRLTQSIDKIQIRKVEDRGSNMARLAEMTFSEKTPEWNYMLYFCSQGSTTLRNEGKVVYSSLVRYVGEQVMWNAELGMEFIRTDWNKLQEYNLNNSAQRPDKNEYADFEPYNPDGIRCGNCLNGWKPGSGGLKPCPCNKGYLNKTTK